MLVEPARALKASVRLRGHDIGIAVGLPGPALANPAIVRLIFASSAQMQAAGGIESLLILRAKAASVGPAEAGSGQAETVALRAWSLVHGLAMLMLDGQLPGEDGLIDTLIIG